MNRHTLAPALLLALSLPAAGEPTLTGRMSNVFGNYVVGYAALLKKGSFAEQLTELDASYANQASDAGVVDDRFRGLPVQGSASFASGARYDFTPSLISAAGHASSTAETPQPYVSLGANAQSALRLSFVVDQPTAFTLSGEVLLEVGTPGSSRTGAVVQMYGGGADGGLWSASAAPGVFEHKGVFEPGVPIEIFGSAATRLNGAASFRYELVLTPVPEAASWALWLAGLGGIAGWVTGWRHPSARTAAPGASLPRPASRPRPADGGRGR